MKIASGYLIGSLLLLVGCASSPVKKLGPNSYVVTCEGDDDMECQEHAWKTCNGAYKTATDDQTGKHLEQVRRGNMVTTEVKKDFKIAFQCEEPKP
jgi:hypothetical protein